MLLLETTFEKTVIHLTSQLIPMAMDEGTLHSLLNSIWVHYYTLGILCQTYSNWAKKVSIFIAERNPKLTAVIKLFKIPTIQQTLGINASKSQTWLIISSWVVFDCLNTVEFQISSPLFSNLPITWAIFLLPWQKC